LFLIGYAVCRFTVEFFREPDSFLGLLFLNLSMGQLLCLPMLFFGLYLMFTAKASQDPFKA
jgi:phosphatidylglycerol:prolipoprotein diacylglycerol transferase